MLRLLPLTLLLVQAVVAQEAKQDKPCIAFSSESDSVSNALAQEPLQDAVMMSGHFEFYAGRHDGCWNVHVLSLPVLSAKGKRVGYVVSHTVTDPQSVEVGHALTFGPDQDIFLQAMNKAAADAIRNIRLVRSNSRLQQPSLSRPSRR
ncbi:MAG: hypothetical protein C5B58_09135 [Acidobacteria bacterium]|nr:MAG: hypothetical protein C5B58_09135 [Acidobacteriota bacterium]